jgi:acyl-CoA synthetase (AMP-forming)/AMP-acid ligase II
MTLDVLKPAYGLAEAALAVTATPLRRAPRALPVDAAALMRREVVPMTEEDSTAMLTSAGPPLPGVDVRIDGGDTVGEILVRSPSNAVGYVGDPERTAEGFRDGWIHTGDVGFFWEGELHIAGRLDDVIQVAGANLNVAAIEHRVALHPALRIGGCALVDLPTRDGEVALVAELRDPEQGELGTLAGELARHVTEQAAVRPRRFVFLDRGALPKTPSGKLQRFRCRELALDSSGVPGHVGTVDLDRRGSAAGIEVAA